MEGSDNRQQVALIIVGMLVSASSAAAAHHSTEVRLQKRSAEMSSEDNAGGQLVWSSTKRKTRNVVNISLEKQDEILAERKETCLSQMSLEIVKLETSSDAAELDGTRAFCEKTWDGMLCWPETPSGNLSILPCPDYINNFNPSGFAFRQCKDDGHWYYSPVYNKTWTNYSLCLPFLGEKSPPLTSQLLLFKENFVIIQLIYYIGYSLSLIVLLFAVAIMLSLRKLRCPRNLLHINLFFSFILRAVLALSRDILMPDGLGLSLDVKRHDNGTIIFNEDGSHWQCRLLLVSFNFAIVANYSWIFIEALYLHTLIFVAVFSETSTILPYVIFGWTMPFVCVFLWAIVRLTLDNVFCWNTHPTPAFFWIIKGPVLVIIILNFCFFLNVIRVLFTKLRAFNSQDSRRYRHRKLVKSALVLIPLFGVPYVCFAAFQESNTDGIIELAKLYFELTFSSFNGVIVAVLYCFFNGEVQSEIRKKWQRYRAVNIRGEGSRRPTMTSNLFSTLSTRCGGHQSFRSGGNSTVVLDHDDQLGTGYETTISTQGRGIGHEMGIAHERRESSGSWNSDSSAIQMKTMNDGKVWKARRDGCEEDLPQDAPISGEVTVGLYDERRLQLQISEIKSPIIVINN